MTTLYSTLRTNLVPNPGLLEQSTTSWFANAGTGATITPTRVLTGGPTGGAFFRSTYTVGNTTAAGANPAASVVADGRAAAALPIPVTPGQAYAASIAGRTSVNQLLAAQLAWYDASGTLVATTPGATAAATAGVWDRWVVAAATCPATAAYARINLATQAGTGAQPFPPGGTFDATQAILEATATAGGYFDGDTTAPVGGVSYAWTGTPGASASVMQELVVTADPGGTGVFVPRADTVWGLGSYDAPALRFNGTDEYGVDWVLGKVDGWKTTTAETPVVRADGADGGWFAPGTRAPKVLTLTGAFRGCSRDQLDAAELRLRAAVEHLAEDTWLWHGGAVPKQMTVRLTGAMVVDDATSTVRTWSAVMTAADPYKYAAGQAGLVTYSTGLAQTTGSYGLQFPLALPANFAQGVTSLGGRIAAINTGSQPVYPLVTYAGPVTTPVLRHLGLGQAEGVATALATGSTAVVDHRVRSVTQDGRSIYAQRVSGTSFYPLLPGQNDLAFTAAAYQAAALVTVSFRPAWS